MVSMPVFGQRTQPPLLEDYHGGDPEEELHVRYNTTDQGVRVLGHRKFFALYRTTPTMRYPI